MKQRRSRHALGWALVFVLAGAASAAAQAKLPAPVAAALKENTDLCREVGGKPNTDAAVKAVDLNGDGKPDYVLDVGSIQCEGAASVYGDREKAVTVYIGDGTGGAARAFGDAVFGVKLEGTTLWLTISGDGCGKPAAADFAHESFCERRLDWNAKTREFEYAPVSTVRMIE